MNKKPSVVVISALLLASACGHRASGEQMVGSAPSPPMTVGSIEGESIEGSSIESIQEDRPALPSITTTTVTAHLDEVRSPEVESIGASVPLNDSQASVAATTSTVAVGNPETTVPQPPADVDLDEVTEALRELDALLGLFEGQVDSVDLDQTEGETP